MKKKEIKFFLVLSILIVVLLILSDNLGIVRYNDMVIGDEEYAHIISSRAESSGLVDEVLFDGEPLFCDKEKHVYYYSLIEGSSSASNPQIELITDNQLKIAFLNEKITETNIRSNATIDFIVYTDEYYACYGLRCTTLPLMNISCREKIGGDNVNIDVLLFDNRRDTANRMISSDGRIHVRGATTRDLPKKSYRVSLIQKSVGNSTENNDVSLLGMRQDDDWLLYSAYNEETKVKNVFSSNLWEASCATDNSINANTGMEYRYLELFINNEYYGLYALGYPIDRKQLNMKQGTGELYKKTQWATEASLEGYVSKGYGEENRDYLREFYEYLDQNKRDANALLSYVDINNLIDMQLFFNLIQGEDNVGTKLYHRGENSTYLKNMYLCIRDVDNGLLGLYCPWDLDMTWRSSPSKNYLMEAGYLEQIIADGNTDIIQRMCDRYWELRENYWSDESLMEMLNEMEDDIFWSGAYLREMERWPEGSYKEGVEGGLTDFKNTVLERIHETDLYYIRLQENLGESYYVIRSLQYKDFRDYNLIIGIGDYQVAMEPDYREFLEYIGINVAQIDESIKFIAVNAQEGKVEYIDRSVGMDESLVTCAGILYINPAPLNKHGLSYVGGVYSVYIDDMFSFDTNDYLDRDISLILIKDGNAEPFNFSKDFQLKGYENHLY